MRKSKQPIFTTKLTKSHEDGKEVMQVLYRRCHAVIFLCAIMIAGLTIGCERKAQPPAGSIETNSIAAIRIKVSEPEADDRWTDFFEVDKTKWQEIAPFLTPTPYREEIAEWTGLGVIEITSQDGRKAHICIFHTGQQPGCYSINLDRDYESKSYYEVSDELALHNRLKQITQTMGQ